MGLESSGFLLAWEPRGAAVLAADIGSIIRNPAVLLGAAAVVVVAVLIVLIMVLRGGPKKAELLQEMDEEQEQWNAAPRGAARSAGKGYDSRDQMLPWEQGGARADGGRPQQASGKRGPEGRDAQQGWGQADQDAQWAPQGQGAPRGGGQWVGTDEWAPPEMAGRGGADQRAQGQMGPRDNDGWGWAANQSPSGGLNGDQWGQGPAVSHPMGRENDQWGQAGGAASPMARGGDDQWGQGPAASHPMARGGDDQWGQDQGAPVRGRGQDQWGSQSGPGAPDEGQWGQGNWGQANGGWSGGEAADRWGQSAAPAQPPQSARPAQPGASRPGGQVGMAGMGGQPQSAPDAGNEWGERGFSGPASGGAQPGGGWGDREPPAWQVEPRREQPGWEAPSWQAPEPEQSAPRGGQRNQTPSRPQWDQADRGSPAPAWEGAGAAGEWAQPDPAPRPNPSRPIEPTGARGMSQPAAGGGEWGNRDFERPTAKPAPSPASWEQREAPAWQPPTPQMAAPAGPVEAPPDRSGPDMRQLGKVSPESTAYAPQAAEASEGAADKTVVMRKDAGAARLPSVVVRQGKEPGRSYDVRQDHITIGRSRESDIFLEDLAVSRLHATIYRDEMGGYLLRDENSANGTSVNGQRVTEVPLQEGDEIQLGQTILAFVRR